MANAIYTKLVVIATLLATTLSATGQMEYFIRFDPANAEITKVDSIPGIRWLRSDAAYNPSANEYTFIGTWDLAQSPGNLFTLNATSGNIVIQSPTLVNPNNIINFQYSISTGIIYAIVYDNGGYHLATINKITGAHTLIQNIPGITGGVGGFTIDEQNQQMFLTAVDNNPNFALWTIDLVNGNVINHVSTGPLSNLQYDNTSQKLYALTNRPGATQVSNHIVSIGFVNPETGVFTNINDLPVTGIGASVHSTFNENQHVFMFTGIEQTIPFNLYSINVSNGNIVSKVAYPSSGVLDNDNTAFFRYDNTRNKLYALFWEAKTIMPAPVVDSTCKLSTETKIYPNPFTNHLFIDKKITACPVFINVYNSLGQLIIKNKKLNDGLNKILLSHLASGVYYYKLISNGNVLLGGKVMKQQ